MNYEIDYHGLSYQAIPLDDRKTMVDPLVAIEYLSDKLATWEARKRDRGPSCSPCMAWNPTGDDRPAVEKPPKPVRPKARAAHESCYGCYLSFLDAEDEPEVRRREREEAYNRAAGHKARVAGIELELSDSGTYIPPAERRELLLERDRERDMVEQFETFLRDNPDPATATKKKKRRRVLRTALRLIEDELGRQTEKRKRLVLLKRFQRIEEELERDVSTPKTRLAGRPPQLIRGWFTFEYDPVAKRYRPCEPRAEVWSKWGRPWRMFL